MSRSLAIAITMLGATAGCTLVDSYPTFGRETCDGRTDGDGDGLVGCADPDCDPSCGEHDPTTCRDGRDNDHDGLVDRLDVGCWQPGSITFDRCATVQAMDVTLGATFGVDWLADPQFGTGVPSTVMTPFGLGLAAGGGATNLLSARSSLGAAAPATITIDLAMFSGPGTPEEIVIGPNLPHMGFRGHGAVIVLSREHCDATTPCTLFYVSSDGTATSVGTLPVDDARHHVSVVISFTGADASTLSATAAVSIDGTSASPVAVALPTVWGATPTLDVGLLLQNETAVLAVHEQRTAFERCGVPDPFPANGVVTSGRWATDGTACLVHRDFANRQWSIGAADPTGRSLPMFSNPMRSDPLLQRLRAVAFDEVRGELVGILTALETGNDLVIQSPTIARAADCLERWEELGPMFVDPGMVIPLAYISSRGTEGELIAFDPNTSTVVHASGDFGMPGSFALDDATATSFVIQGATQLGNDWLLMTAERGGAGLRRLADAACGDCVLAVLLPSGEPGTFDETFVSGQAVVMPPPPTGASPWSGLFFYGATGGGYTWMRVAH